MGLSGTSERATQERVKKLFQDELGYPFLGDWSDRPDNSNVEESILRSWLGKRGYSGPEIGIALRKLSAETDKPGRGLYGNNKAVYSLLRYGIDVKAELGQNTRTVELVDWKHPGKNDFAIAEEVTLHGLNDRRPDLVLYLNGIAIAVIELKKSSVSIGDGIRQLISNQRPEFNEWFFSTVQIVFAGSDSEGLRYGTVGTEEKYFLTWKEDEDDDSRYKLDKYLLKLCDKKRLIELIHDFVLFDGGLKKLPRVHQYFGIKAAQSFVRGHRSGIIWHTQGSGKSIVMVMLAKWILENIPNGRVVIITDRDELDKQIEGVFHDADEKMLRCGSGRELMRELGRPRSRLICALVHKFGNKGEVDFDAYIEEIEAASPLAAGDLFVFVDECHRSQGGKLNKAMKAVMRGATFIGFTGTPLLRQDRQTTLEVFGGAYIHTYKFNEAVEDGVVLDLVYEARDVDQRLSSGASIDAWFEAKTKGLNQWKKDELKTRWGTMQRVLSSKSRMGKIVADILLDFATKPRLSGERGTAMLVASSIYEACRYFELFLDSSLSGKCAIVTSYNPDAKDVSKEDTGASTETEKEHIYKVYTGLLKDVTAEPGKGKTETYEDRAKRLFIEEPANMKLLIVVDKLLTGFDAPSCSYLYIDKSMRDHGLFQAICRTNRLDGLEKDFGRIIDYKDLFKNLVNDKGTGALQVYTSELDTSFGGSDPCVLMQDRLVKGRERLEAAFESLAIICEPIPVPGTNLDIIRYFCGNTEIAADLEDREPRRAALYSSALALIRAFASIADELPEAGYDAAEIESIKRRQKRYLEIRDTVRNAAGEILDGKAYEADMRYLIDTYIEASEPRKISPFDDIGLVDLIVRSGIMDAIAARLGMLKGDKDAVAETIENNVRARIKREHLNDPAFYERMSALLDEIIRFRRENAEKYEEYLKRIAELARDVTKGYGPRSDPRLDTPGRRALFENLKAARVSQAGTQRANEDVAEGDRPYAKGDHEDEGIILAVLAIDDAVKRNRQDGWMGVPARERGIKRAMFEVLGNEAEVEQLFPIVKVQAEYR